MPPNGTVLSCSCDAAQDDLIAIVGIGCRFSGLATTPEGFWHMLAKGISSWSNNGSTRFNLDSFWRPEAGISGSFNCQGLHLLKQHPAAFDNGFFGISGTEAKAIDPQQRMMLEVAYEAFENAGVTLNQLEGSQTGVYCAVSNCDYEQILGRDPELSPSYRFTGTGPSIIANRISYCFDLRGPSMTIDTACSSTLVAVHEACRALRSGDVRQALVGGTNLLLDPEKLAIISSMHFLSPHGRCYPFDARASGYGRGEGVAAILLKPLKTALKDGDTIRSVIRGSSVASDGRTSGITIPSVHAQLQTIQKAYGEARIDPRETLYVEAHGTGTKVGDKTEATALKKAFCEGRWDDQTLFVGTVKANLGHTECTAGLAGLIKAVLILEKGLIPPNPNFKKPSDELAFRDWGLQIPTKVIPWPKDIVRRASINATGYGGTNSHVVLESVPTYFLKEREPAIDSRSTDIKISRPRLFPLTHQRDDGLGKWAQSLKRSLAEAWVKERHLSLDSLAYTLAARRSHFSYRATIVASDFKEFRDGLDKLTRGVHRSNNAGAQPLACFAFTGQGSQWAGMGCELLALFPIFAQSMRNAEEELVRLGAKWDLLAEIGKPEHGSFLHYAWLSQPCCTAVQIALVDLLNSWGISPDVVCGHSSGEIGAAYAAGVLTARDALKVSFSRGEAVRSLRMSNPDISGSMLAVGLSENDVQKYITDFQDNVVVACVNSPASITLSGDQKALEEVQQSLDAEGIFNRILNVDAAYHSHHMRLVQQRYTSFLEDIEPSPARDGIQFVSSVTGQRLMGNEMDKSYWVQNLVSPVRFSDALMKIVDLWQRNSKIRPGVSTNLIIEIGPHCALRNPIVQILKACGAANSTSYQSVMKKKEDASRTATSLAGDLFTQGVDVAFESINNPEARFPREVVVNLPPYCWDHEKLHWSESRRSTAYRFRKFPKHDLLGAPTVDSISTEPTWRNHLRLRDLPWLRGHCVHGQFIFPGAGFIAMITEALREQFIIQKRGWKKLVVHCRQIVFIRPLLIPDTSSGVETLVSLRPYSYSALESSVSWNEFRVFTLAESGEATEHCRGLVSVEKGGIKPSVDLNTLASVNELSERSGKDKYHGWTRLEPERMYRVLKDLGANYSGSVAQLDHILGSPHQSLCEFTIADVGSTMPSERQQHQCVHPLTLESCFQSVFVALKFGDELQAAQLLLAIDDLEISTDTPSEPGIRLSVEARTTRFGCFKNKADFFVTGVGDGKDKPLIRAKGVVFASVDASSEAEHTGNVEKKHLCHLLEWSMDPLCSSTQSILKHCRVKIASPTQKLRTNCDTFCQSIIRQTLQSLTPEDEQKISGYQSNLLRWMRSQKVDNAPVIDESFRNRIKALGATGEVLVRLGQQIVEILQGQVDPLAILLEHDLLYRLYYEDNTLNHCHMQLAKYVQLWQFKNPNIRILELGGGTGSLTIPLANTVFNQQASSLKANACRYTFTDISTSFASHVKSRLEKFDGLIEYRKLDIEMSPEAQGFELGSFDLIVASNVVHITRNLANTLQHLRTLLKPNGRIAFAELTHPSLRWGILGGCLPGWWLGVEEGRSKSPLLSTNGWHDMLKNNGFSGVSLEMRDYESDEEHEMSLMISRAISTQEKVPSITMNIVSRSNDDGLANHLCKLLLMQTSQTSASKADLMNTSPNNGIFIFLLEIEAPFLILHSDEEWQRIRAILCSASGVLWITKGGAVDCSEAANALITGLSRSIRSENHELKLVTLDLDPMVTCKLQIADDIQKFLMSVFEDEIYQSSQNEWEFAIRDGAVLVPRLIPDERMNGYVQDCVSKYHPRDLSSIDRTRALGLQIHSPGLMDSLYWADMPAHSRRPKAEEVRIELQYFSLNFRDVITALGELDGSSAFLIEGTGIVAEVGDNVTGISPGDRVYAFNADGLATTSNVNAEMVIRIPEEVDMERAAAVPVAYATSLYSLQYVAAMRAKESILIHSAAGAVGQAAIAIAQLRDAGEIFVTVGNSDKAEMLQKKFGIPAENIFSSRDVAFGHGILSRTNGKGVDIILNSLTSDAIRESCAVLAPFGRFIEIGKKDLLTNGRLEMNCFARNATFSTVDLVLLAELKPKLVQELFRTVLDLVGTSKVQFFEPTTIKPISEIEEAFRSMQSGKHMGKFLVQVVPDLPLKVQPARPKLARLRQESSYLVVGGTGGLGRVIVSFLVKLGARQVILLSRSGGNDASMQIFAKEIRENGAELIVIKGSVADLDVVKKIREMAQGRPVGGVIQGVMAVQDSPVERMTAEQWHKGIEGKVAGTRNLQLTFGDSLDFLILLSSTGAIIGTYAQGNYCAANTFQDAFARSCVASSVPVRSIDIGLVAREGVTTDENVFNFIAKQGLRPHALEDLTAVINYVIQNPKALTPAQAQIILGAGREDPDSGTKEAVRQRPDAKFSHIWTKSLKNRAVRTEAGEFAVQAALRAASTSRMAVDATYVAFKQKISQLLAVVEADVQADRSVASYGVDSLTAVELRNWVASRLSSHVQTLEIMSSMSVVQLAEVIAKRSRLVNANVFEKAEAK